MLNDQDFMDKLTQADYLIKKGYPVPITDVLDLALELERIDKEKKEKEQGNEKSSS